MQELVDRIILKLPAWIRWLFLLPMAFIAELAAQSIYQVIFSKLLPIGALRPYTDEFVWRFFAPFIFIVAGLKMAPKYWFKVACCLIGFKSAIALLNICNQFIYLRNGGSLKTPSEITEAPIWWSLLVHILFLAFAVLIITKQKNIRMIPSKSNPILDF